MWSVSPPSWRGSGCCRGHRTKVAVRHAEDVVRVRAKFVAERLVHMRWSMVRLAGDTHVSPKSALGDPRGASEGRRGNAQWKNR